ncbi:MAG: mandelate racemase/muconate lactonizing enzyme family protein [Planctomycetes bacterium]|nr:mandelate racemase/muconate lactonizing enzyme family protein [Planctomycetota bacterium]
MKISSVQTFHVQHRLPKAIGPSTFMYRERDSLLVKLTTDDGLTGWGETAVLGDVRGIIEKQIGPALLGKDPRQHRKNWRQMWGPNFGNGLAVGAVDIALHDLWGKALGLPIAELYGGRLRERVPVYASTMNYTEDENPEQQYPRDAKAAVQMGFRAMKMRLGGQPLERDVAAAAAVRQAVGKDIKLMADGNGAYTLSTAIRMGNELDRLGFYWFEEPLPESPCYAGYEVLTDKLDIAIAGGEVLDSRGPARELICRRAFDIIQPDVSLCGGIGECLFVCEMARLWSMQSNPHCWGGAIVIAATLHVLALLPDETWSRTTETPMLELDVYENPFRDKLVKQPVEVRDGFVDVPTKPGLGIDIDEDVIKHYQINA